jgi:hypothetical protein
MSGNNGSLVSRWWHSRYITTVALPVLILLVLIFTLLPETTLAHPPSDMELEYDIGKQTLVVSISHSVSNPDSHYVEKIEIKKNGNLYLTEDYTNQPSTSTFTYTYDVTASDGDVLEATAYCSLQGSITEQVNVFMPPLSATPTLLPTPLPTPTPAQTPCFEALFAIIGVLAAVYLIKRN